MTFASPENLFFLPLSRDDSMSVGRSLGRGASRSESCSLSAVDTPLFVGDRANESLKILQDIGELPAHYWPLVLSGPSGAGKTALARSIVERVVTEVPTGVSAGRFASQHEGFRQNSERVEPSIRSLGQPHIRYPSSQNSDSHSVATASPQFQYNDSKPVNPHWLLISATDFARGITDAIDTRSVDQFIDRLLSFAAIAFDDIDDLKHYPAAQTVFSCVVDRLLDQDTALVFTIKTAPDKLLPDCGLSHQIISRISSGLVIPISHPGYAARCHLLSDLAKQIGVPLSVADIQSMAQSFPLPLSRLKQLVVEAKQLLTIELAGSSPAASQDVASSRVLASISQSLTSDEEKLCLILDLVAKQFNVKKSNVLSTSRKQTVVLARNVSVYLGRDVFGFSYSLLGSFLGGRDHSTTMHSYRKIFNQIQIDSDFSSVIDTVRRQLIDFASLKGRTV